MKIYQAYSDKLGMWAGRPTEDIFEAQDEADFENRFGGGDFTVREGEVRWKEV